MQNAIFHTQINTLVSFNQFRTVPIQSNFDMNQSFAATFEYGALWLVIYIWERFRCSKFSNIFHKLNWIRCLIVWHPHSESLAAEVKLGK